MRRAQGVACSAITACWLIGHDLERGAGARLSNSKRSANSTGAPASSVDPVLLDAAEMATVLSKFASYGQQA
jgi:hypothetical protein